MFGARRDLYVAKHVQDECGKDQALELETARYLMYGTFHLRSESEATSVHIAFIAALAVMLLAAAMAILRRNMPLTRIIDDVNFWIFLIMGALMVPVYLLTTNVLTRNFTESKNVKDAYIGLQDTMPITDVKDAVEGLEAFPKPFVDALVRRWYAVHPEERRKPDEIRNDVFADMIARHSAATDKITLSQPFYEFIGYVHPPSDFKLANRSQGGAAIISAKTGATMSANQVENYKRGQIFLESLRPLLDPYNFDQSSVIGKQINAVEWVLFISFLVLAIFYILLPLSSDVAYGQIYGNPRIG